jgi:arylsulfatase A-like enzyme
MDPLTRRSFNAALAAQAVSARSPRPNLVFVFSDQQSRDMLGCYGNSQIVTPHIDQFARQSVLFRHCVTNSPLCTPYRGLLLSGRHPLHSGALENDIRMLPGNGNYFGEVLRNAGYRLGYVGKWHLYGGNRVRPIPPGPYRYGFDHTFLSNNCTVVFDAARAYYWDENGQRQLYGDWEPYAQTRQAIRFIEENAGQPFALFLSWHPPHNWAPPKPPARTPEEMYGAPDDLLQLYDPDSIRVRGNCEDTAAIRRGYRGYMAMCTSLDRAFAQLMTTIDEKGLTKNTIVVYTSDHGDTLFSHGLRYNKMRPEIESIGVPLLIRYPGVLRPRACDLLVGTLDLMPTLLGLMGLPIPPTCQGRNLAEEIRNEGDNAVDSVPLFLLNLDWRGVYTRRYTYCFDTWKPGGDDLYRRSYFSQPAGLPWNCLYDREEDRWELKNLFDSPDHQKLKAGLHERTIEWMRRLGDPCLPYEAVVQACMSQQDISLRRTGAYFGRLSGVLLGRPSQRLFAGV